METKTIRIFTATYNINAQKQCLSNRSLLNLLGDEFQDPPDIFAIGFDTLT